MYIVSMEIGWVVQTKSNVCLEFHMQRLNTLVHVDTFDGELLWCRPLQIVVQSSAVCGKFVHYDNYIF